VRFGMLQKVLNRSISGRHSVESLKCVGNVRTQLVIEQHVFRHESGWKAERDFFFRNAERQCLTGWSHADLVSIRESRLLAMFYY
jgi:hypothetical protein